MKRHIERFWFSVKKGVDIAGIGYPLREAYVHVRSLGEYGLHCFHGHPSPRSAILIAGAGRSGTTWLGELISYGSSIQEIFEPLLPFWNNEVRELTGWRTDGPWLQGLYLRADEPHCRWHDHFYRIFTGRVRNYWTDARRTSWLPTRYLVKEIRMNLMLGFVARQLGPRILFILRDPSDVVASRLALGWQVDLSYLLAQERLVADHLQPWVDELRQVSDRIEQHAAWWAVENLVAMRELADYEHDVVLYEDLLERPSIVASALREKLGIAGPIPTITAVRPSRMAGQRPQKLNRATLSAADMRKIRHWCHRDELLNLFPRAAERWR